MLLKYCIHISMTNLYQHLLTNKYVHLSNCMTSRQIQTILAPKEPLQYQKPVTSRRTITKQWNGTINLTDVDLQYFSYVVLADGRIDISLPIDLGIQLGNLPKLKQLGLSSDYQIRAYNLLILPPSDKEQVWHQDNGGCSPEDYYTILIPLNHSTGMGKTEVAIPYTSQFRNHKEIICPNVKPGDALVFSGSLWHRGTPNLSKDTRYCLYLILSRLPQEKIFEKW